MARHFAYSAARPLARGTSSLACLAFVAILGIAFWAGAVWIGQAVLRITGLGF
jgi:hypothetical protein